MQVTRILLSVLLLCAPAMEAQMQVMRVVRRTAAGAGGTPIALVQHVASAYAGGTSALSVNFTNNTSGHILVIAVRWCSSSATTITGVTDTATNSYTISAASMANQAATHYSNCYTQFAYNLSAASYSGTNAVTVVFSGAYIASGSVDIYELTGGQLDQINAGTNANTNTPTPGSITTSVNGCYSIAIGVLDNGFGFSSAWFTAGSGWTLGSENGGGNLNGVSEHQAQASAGMLTANFGTNFSGTTGPNAGSIITFKP